MVDKHVLLNGGCFDNQVRQKYQGINLNLTNMSHVTTKPT
jgi:hypothetical protein